MGGYGLLLELSNVSPMCNFSLLLFADTSPQTKDISDYCLSLLTILQQAASLSERVTALKLLEAWYSRGQPSLRVRGMKSLDVPREDGERVIMHLLLEGVFREEFHFTPYSTISYLVTGSKAKAVLSGKRVSMHLSAIKARKVSCIHNTCRVEAHVEKASCWGTSSKCRWAPDWIIAMLLSRVSFEKKNARK